MKKEYINPQLEILLYQQQDEIAIGESVPSEPGVNDDELEWGT